MSKKIFFTDDILDDVVNKLRKEINKSSKINEAAFITKALEDNRRASIIFTPRAWVKMTSLVSDFQTEVQWHGTVTRMSPESSDFLIDDILVPPHEVSSGTVISEQKEYEDWLHNQLPAEVFSKIRFHGHSHVNMGVDPSPTDCTFRRGHENNLGEFREGRDKFYIFLIINKRGEISAEVYDLSLNARYETKEIDFDVFMDDFESLNEFIGKAKIVAKEAPRFQNFSKPTKAKKMSAEVYNPYSYEDEDWYGAQYYPKAIAEGVSTK